MCNSDEIFRFTSFSYRNDLIAFGALLVPKGRALIRKRALMNRVLHSVLRTSRMYETKRRRLLGNKSRRLENEVKNNLLIFRPGSFQ